MENTPLRKIKLYGKLRKFGREFELAVRSPAEAIKALCVMIDGFEKFLMTSKENGLVYAVFVGKNNISEEELGFNGQGEIRIAPVIAGSKRGGLFQVIVGAIMVAAVVMTGGMGLAVLGTGGLLGGIGMMGVSMMLGGIVQMLSPQPKGMDAREAVENKPSYAFGGSVNTTAYGNPVGILAGERIIGGAVISAGVYTDDI